MTRVPQAPGVPARSIPRMIRGGRGAAPHLQLRLLHSDDAFTSTAPQERDLRASTEREGWKVRVIVTDE